MQCPQLQQLHLLLVHCESQRKGGLAQAGGAGRAALRGGACVSGRCVAAAQRAARSAAPLLLMVM